MVFFHSYLMLNYDKNQNISIILPRLSLYAVSLKTVFIKLLRYCYVLIFITASGIYNGKGHIIERLGRGDATVYYKRKPWHVYIIITWRKNAGGDNRDTALVSYFNKLRRRSLLY